MATISADKLRIIRNRAERKAVSAGVPITWVKGAINAAAQAITDTLDGDSPIQRSEVPPAGERFDLIMSARIDNATAPFSVSFSNQEKKWLFAFVCEFIYGRDG